MFKMNHILKYRNVYGKHKIYVFFFLAMEFTSSTSLDSFMFSLVFLALAKISKNTFLNQLQNTEYALFRHKHNVYHNTCTITLLWILFHSFLIFAWKFFREFCENSFYFFKGIFKTKSLMCKIYIIFIRWIWIYNLTWFISILTASLFNVAQETIFIFLHYDFLFNFKQNREEERSIQMF